MAESSRATNAPPGLDDDEPRVSTSWFTRLRWMNYGGALAIVLISAFGLRLDLPLPGLLGILFFGGITNASLAASAVRQPWTSPHVVGGLLVLDVGLLTGLLHLTGGAYNPFTLLYLNFVVVAAVTLQRRWMWTIAALSVVCFGLLFWLGAVPLTEMAPGQHGHHGHHGHGSMNEHLYGMWVASGVAAVFIGMFVDGQRRLLAARGAELRTERVRVERAERLASLATLAAGAAHELSTPLSTIAVVAAELEETLVGAEQEEAREDATLIRNQVRRCHQVLEQLGADSGAHAGEARTLVDARALSAQVIDKQHGGERVDVSIGDDVQPLCLPRRMVTRAVRSLVDNALRADPLGRPSLVITTAPGGWRITVEDSGPGMDPTVRERALEPFFTTRDHGMGLGLYLVQEVARQMGGDLTLTEADSGGVSASLRLEGQT